MRNIYIKTVSLPFPAYDILCGKGHTHTAYTRFGVETGTVKAYKRQATHVERYTTARSHNVYTSSGIVTV
jgi:hypothetical protein